MSFFKDLVPLGYIYVVTKGNSLSLIFYFCFSPDQCLEARLTPDHDLSIPGLGDSCALRSQGTLQMLFFFFEEFLIINLISSPLMKLLFTPEGGTR